MNDLVGKENSRPTALMQPSNLQLKALWTRSTNRLTTTFDTISQKLRRSTRRREPLINSPGTPCKSNSTPVKMYSPFGIDTPKVQPPLRPPRRQSSARRSLDKPKKSCEGSFNDATTPPKANRLNPQLLDMSPKLANELQQTQIGVYQLHHAANSIITSHVNTSTNSQ